MGLDLTNVLSNIYRVKRNVLGISGDLKLIALKTGSTGYDPVLTVSDDEWFGKRVTRRALGRMFFEIKIADKSGNVATTVRQKRPSHVLVGNLYYKVVGLEEPVQDTKKYLIRCEPTGEKKPA